VTTNANHTHFGQ